MRLAGYVGTTKNLQIVLNTPQNPYLNQATQKILAKFSLPKKIPESKISIPKKFIAHPHHLKSGKPPFALHSIVSGLNDKKSSYIHFNG